MGLRTQKRRRRECRTDYKARKNLLVSGLTRIVVRQTNKYFILQSVESVESQDKVLVTMTSKELLKNGWDEKKAGSLKSIPAGYLTGILMAKKLGKGSYIVDLGMTRTRAGCRSFAVVKGLIDGGLDISANEKVFPSEDRLLGEHSGIKDMVVKCKDAIEGIGNRQQVIGKVTKKTKAKGDGE